MGTLSTSECGVLCCACFIEHQAVRPAVTSKAWTGTATANQMPLITTGFEGNGQPNPTIRVRVGSSSTPQSVQR
jgi:hypothetical protein